MDAIQIMRATGGYLNASNLLEVPGVRAAYDELLKRIQALPFVPPSWLSTVQEAMKVAGPSYTWMPRPAINPTAWKLGKALPLLDDIPPWLTAPDAAQAWNTLTDWMQKKLQPILEGWARDQAAIVNSANNDAMFWNGLYAIVKPVAVVGEVIITAPEKVASTVSRSFMGALKGLAPILIVAAIVGVGFLVYKSGAYKKYIK